MIYAIIIFLFLLGLTIGSFLNVAAVRYKAGGALLTKDVLTGRSRCPHCKKVLTWRELIPLASFVIQGGRCLSCGRALSWQYPIVELLSGLTLAGGFLFFYRYFKLSNLAMMGQPAGGYYGLLIIWLLAILTFILLALIDLRLKVIPDQLNLFLVILGLAMAGIRSFYELFSLVQGSFLGHYALLFGLRGNIWINYLAAFLFGIALFGALIVLSRGRGMGVGDLKLAGALGVLLGWPDVFFALIFAFIIGALWSLGLIIAKKKTLKDMIPFGPFMALGALTVVFLGKQILNGYFQIFNLF
jgi:prepilin signal peptidase PulO-like enzyme (type II secretory pathway)